MCLAVFNRYWGVYPSGLQQFEARYKNQAFSVDIGEKTCSCRAWQLSGIPCLHAIAALAHLNISAESYVSLWYKSDMFLNAYRYNIQPINGSAMWPNTDYTPPLPPKKRRMPGRPTIKRKTDASEREDRPGKQNVSRQGLVIKCSICKQKGHNKKTCHNSFPTEGSSSKAEKKKKKQCARKKTKVDGVCD